MNDVYIIVEKKADKTVRIADKFGANIYVRKNIGDKKRKGYALDEGIKYILRKKKKYDLFFIFDADNVVGPNFINEMLETYKNGYDIATGYRNIKNNENVITSCSGLTFTLINTLINKTKMAHNKAIIISGTGFYIASDLINKWHGYPFHSLTEDYELSLYASANNITTYYNDQAEFFDEQPNTMEQSLKQRTRWVKGFLESRNNYIKNIKDDYEKILGITPYIFILLGFLMFFIISFVLLIIALNNSDPIYTKYLFYFLVCPFILYLILFVISYTVIMIDIERLNISGKNIIASLFYNPIFLFTYIICLFRALKHENIEWEKIEH
jgi:1,2-diacylglycerol 3-beta-glucosyltransferase